MQKMKVTIFILAFLSMIQPIFAQTNYPQFPFQTWFSPEALATFLGVPSDWLVVPRVIYYVIIPFIAAVAVTYGILTELRIFRVSAAAGKINLLLSVAMAFLLLPSGILTLIVTYFYAANTFIGLIGFGILFLFGTIMWVYGRGRAIRHETGYQADIVGSLRGRLKAIDEEIRRLEREIPDDRLHDKDTSGKEKRLDELRKHHLEIISKIREVQKPI